MTNVLVIAVDDMRYDHFDFMPLTQKWFKHGTKFTACRLNCAICNPYRLGFLTGQYAQGANNGVIDHSGNYTSVNFTTNVLFPWMSTAGFYNGFIGKAPINRGSSAQTGVDYQRTFTNATEQKSYGFSIFDGVGTTSPAGYTATYLKDQALAFFDVATAPWFLWLTPSNPHVASLDGELYGDVEDVFRWSDYLWPHNPDPDITDKPSWIQEFGAPTPNLVNSMRRGARGQLKEIGPLDRMVDAILTDLRTSGMLSDTVVIFTSDNGVHYGEQRIGFEAAAAKNTPYDPSVRTLLLCLGPGFDVGKIVNVPVTSQDIAATVVDIANATPTTAQDGTSLLTIAANPSNFLTRGTLYQRTNAVAVGNMPAGEGIFKMTRKLVRYPSEVGNDKYEMYDLDSDPQEHINVANDAGRLSERNALEAELDALLV